MRPQGFHVVLSDMCHSTMGSSSADVLRSLDLASCAAELAVGTLGATPVQQLPKVYNPMPEDSRDSSKEPGGQPDQQPEGLQDTAIAHGSNGVLLPKGHLVMKLLQVPAQHLRKAFSQLCLQVSEGFEPKAALFHKVEVCGCVANSCWLQSLYITSAACKLLSLHG